MIPRDCVRVGVWPTLGIAHVPRLVGVPLAVDEHVEGAVRELPLVVSEYLAVIRRAAREGNVSPVPVSHVELAVEPVVGGFSPCLLGDSLDYPPKDEQDEDYPKYREKTLPRCLFWRFRGLRDERRTRFAFTHYASPATSPRT